MKRLLFVLCAGLMIGGQHAHAEPFDESKGYMFYELAKPLRKTIVPPQGNIPVDDYVIQLSKSADLNFIADASQIPTDAWMQPFPASYLASTKKWKPTFYGVLEDFGTASRLARLRYDDNTYLLWSKPDATEMAKLTVASEKYRPAQGQLDVTKMYLALDEYARHTLGWNGTSTTTNFPRSEGKLGDLPPELNEQVKTLARYVILRPDLRRELLLTDDYWKSAQIRVQPTGLPGKQIAFIGGKNEKGETLSFFRPFSARLVWSDAFTPTFLGLPADGLTAPKATEKTPVIAGALTATQLEAEGALQTKVSIEAKRCALGDLLNEISQKNGIVLKMAAGENASTKLLTLRVNEMPLGTLMGAIARVYSGDWRKDDGAGYVLHLRQLDALEGRLLTAGRGDFYNANANETTVEEQIQQFGELEQEVIEELKPRGATRPEEVPISQLSEDLQTRLRRAVTEMATDEILKSYQKAWQYTSDEALIRMGRVPQFPGISDEILELSKQSARGADWSLKLLMPDNRETLMPNVLLSAPPQPQPQKVNE